MAAAGEFIHENLNAVLQYGDWFTPGEMKQIEELKMDDGVILREGLKKVAVYKDRENKIHVNSFLCIMTKIHRNNRLMQFYRFHLFFQNL